MRVQRTSIILILASTLLGGCSSLMTRSSTLPSVPVLPQVVQQQGGGSYIEFPLNPGSGHQPFSLTASINETVWFCDRGGFVGRMDMTGNEIDYPLPDGCDYLNFTTNIANNPDGDVYVSNSVDGVTQISPTGQLSTFYLHALTGPIVSDSFGNIWTPDGTGSSANLYEINPATGSFIIYVVPGPARQYIGDLVAAPDGTVWFSDFAVDNSVFYVDQINQQGLTIQHQVIAPDTYHQPLVVGPDGGIWFASKNAMGRIDEVTGQITYMPMPPPFKPIAIVVGPNKTLYFINRYTSKIFRFSITKNKLLSPVKMPGTYDAMTMGPDQNLWLSDQFDNRIDVAVLRQMSTVPTSVTLGVSQSQTVTVSEKHSARNSYSAASSNKSISTVAPGNASDEFVVTGVSAGSCVATISDAIGNSIAVAVTVQ